MCTVAGSKKKEKKIYSCSFFFSFFHTVPLSLSLSLSLSLIHSHLISKAHSLDSGLTLSTPVTDP